MRHILFVEASSGGVVGGSLTGLYHLIRGLDPKRFTSSMVLYERKEGIEADLRALGVPVYYIHRRRVPREHALQKFEGYRRVKRAGGIRSLFRTARQTLRLAIEELPATLQLMRIIRRTRADVVHLGNGARANYDGILACRLTRTPCVCHIKGFEKFSDRERRAAPSIEMVLCMTEAIRQHCRTNGILGQRTEVVYDALDDAGFQPQRDRRAVRAELGIADDTPCAGVVGNVQEWKGQIVLVEAMAEVVRAVPEARGFIVGGVHRAGAAYSRELETRVQALGLSEKISVTGFRTDIADVMNALDVVVHTSVRPEAFGRVILEGMLLGKPVVATAAGGVPELVRDGETGFLTPPGDAHRLAQSLIPLLRDPEMRRRVGERAREWARERFNLERHVAEMSAIYESISKSSTKVA